MSEWIKSSERLPDNDLPMFVYTRHGNYDVARCYPENGYFQWQATDGAVYSEGAITHWMLPAPPAEEVKP